MEPNIKDFLEYMDKNANTKLSKYQKELAETLILYRVKHFSGGFRGGRTTVVDAVQSYFSNIYPNHSKAGKEI